MQPCCAIIRLCRWLEFEDHTAELHICCGDEGNAGVICATYRCTCLSRGIQENSKRSSFFLLDQQFITWDSVVGRGSYTRSLLKLGKKEKDNRRHGSYFMIARKGKWDFGLARLTRNFLKFRIHALISNSITAWFSLLATVLPTISLKIHPKSLKIHPKSTQNLHTITSQANRPSEITRKDV